MTLKFPFRNPAWQKKGEVPTKELDRLNVMTSSLVDDDDDDVDTPAAKKTDDVETLGSLGWPRCISTTQHVDTTTPTVWGQPSPKVSTDNAINRLIRSAALSFDDDASSPIPTTNETITAYTTAIATPRRCNSTTIQPRLPPTITMCNTMDTYPNEEVVADYDLGKVYLDRTSTKETATMDSWSLQTASDCCNVGEEIQLADSIESKQDTLESSKEDTLESKDDNKVSSKEDTLESSKEDTIESNNDNKVDIVTKTTVTSPPVVCVCDDSVVADDYDQFFDQGKEILYLGRTPTKNTATIHSLSLQKTASEDLGFTSLGCHDVEEIQLANTLESKDDKYKVGITNTHLETTTPSYPTSACAATQTDLDRLTTVLRDRTQALEKVRTLLEREQKQGKDR